MAFNVRSQQVISLLAIWLSAALYVYVAAKSANYLSVRHGASLRELIPDYFAEFALALGPHVVASIAILIVGRSLFVTFSAWLMAAVTAGFSSLELGSVGNHNLFLFVAAMGSWLIAIPMLLTAVALASTASKSANTTAESAAPKDGARGSS